MSRLDLEPSLVPGQWRTQARRAREEGFSLFDWLTAVDRTDADPAGFDVVARLLDVTTPRAWRARVLRTRVADGADLESLTPVYAGAAWHEREVFEMFGIRFSGFEDGTGRGLRRLLLVDVPADRPLRKSAALAARGRRPWPGATSSGAAKESARNRRRPPPGVPVAAAGPEPGAAEEDR